ncbi:MAG TPA: hypothetical protein PLP21_11575 [Pyrinomonadaceae bacterium]|nr:hypothetical protein [Acidobacteriota bacterium]HQZ96949.1 hypothetical protein [Pyrinomonadaceae bacterium]
MRNRDVNDNRSDMPETAIIRRMRSRRSFRVESAEAIYFDVAAFRLDRKLGIAEHIAVERNLSLVNAWPDILG